jgi:hypothetical protein
VKPPIAYDVYGERVTAALRSQVELPYSHRETVPFSVIRLLHVAYAGRRVRRRMVRD